MMRVRWLPPSVSVVAALVSLASLSCSGRMERTTRPTVATDPARAPQSAGANTASTTGASQPGFYPLTVGNRWVYRQDVVVQLFPDSAPPPPPERSEASITREILEPAPFDGREYLGELTTTTRPGGIVDQWYS